MSLDDDIKYTRPKLTEVSKYTKHLKGVTRKVTQIIEDTLDDKSLEIPVRANIHPLGARECIRLEQAKGSKVWAVATLLTTLLISKSQSNVVTVSYDRLSELSGISIRTIARAIIILEDSKFIYREGKQNFRLSAKLAWFGNYVDWAIELKKLTMEGIFSNEDYINSIDSNKVKELPILESNAIILEKVKSNAAVRI